MLGLVAVVAAAALLLSGGSGSDPETPTGLPGLPPPFLGVAVLGDGGVTAAVDSYGTVVDLRRRPAGRALIETSAARQAAGTVPEETGIQAWAVVAGEKLPFWRADEVRQRYLPRTNVLETRARFGSEEVAVREAVHGGKLVVVPTIPSVPRVRLRVHEGGDLLDVSPEVILAAAAADRRWLRRARPLGTGAPAWARRMYERSLLVLHALTDRETGAVAAGARGGWAYVWPRDAATVAIALAAAGYEPEAELVTQFLLGAGIEQAARFHGDGSPVPGRDAQGDAIGWVAAAAEATGIVNARQAAHILAGGEPIPWRDRADYWEGEPGDYLGNALASGEPAIRHLYGAKTPARLLREPGEAKSGLDSAAAWAVRPFSEPRLYPAARRTMKRLLAEGGRFGITPGKAWPGGEDPWSAPTAWTSWSLAALGERRDALRLMSDLRRAATPAGALPERVDAKSGVPTSTTPLAWSHAFAILALRELWPSD